MPNAPNHLMSTEHILKASTKKKRIGNQKWQDISDFGNNTSIKILNFRDPPKTKRATVTLLQAVKLREFENFECNSTKNPVCFEYLLLVCL